MMGEKTDIGGDGGVNVIKASDYILKIHKVSLIKDQKQGRGGSGL